MDSLIVAVVAVDVVYWAEKQIRSHCSEVMYEVGLLVLNQVLQVVTAASRREDRVVVSNTH